MSNLCSSVMILCALAIEKYMIFMLVVAVQSEHLIFAQ